jgi:hypothetical protein
VTITGATSSASGIQRDANGRAGAGPNTASAGAATAVTATARTYAQLSAGTVDEFMTHARAHADWSMSITDAAQQTELRTLLTWLDAGGHRPGPLAGFTVSDVTAVRADYPKVDAYCRAAADQPTVKVDPAATPTLAEMVGMGGDILKLEAVLAGAILHQIFTPEEFDGLRSEGRIDLFCTYVRTCAPLLHAHDGVEIFSFRTLADTGDPSAWHDLRDIRNTHRFQAAALDQLRINQAGNPSNKPLTLILHSAFDHNGAFHQDPNLTQAITNASNHTIMIEGAESLDAIAGRLPAIVALHGRTEADPNNPGQQIRRIDQLMIAGHGSAHSIELAGTLAENPDGSPRTNSRGNLVTDEDDLEVRGDPNGDPSSEANQHARDSRAFMQTLMNMMSTDPSSPHRRIVFNACLTASNELPIHRGRGPDGALIPTVDPTASPDDQARQMREAIAGSPSLVETMRGMAPAGGPEVRGGNGSFGQVGLIDASGALDIVADGASPTGNPDDARGLDPQLTNPSKLAYVEDGRDPGGCMSAVAECWANDRATCIPAVHRRRQSPKGTDWDETVIQAMYELVETRYPANGSGITILAGQTEGFKELPSESQSHPWTIWHVRADEDWTLLHTRLGAHGAWTGSQSVPVVFFHGWMVRNAAKKADFLTAVGRMNARTIAPFIHLETLISMWPSLVPASAANPPEAGPLVLAIRDLHVNPAAPQGNTRTFLSSLVDSHAFKAGVDVAPALGNLHRPDWVLETLGLDAASAAGAPSPSPTGAAPQDGNVDMNADGINESLVEPLSINGRVRVATRLYVREQASRSGRAHSTLLADGTVVYIMGQTGDWYLIDHGGTRGYSSKNYIEQLESDAAGAPITAPVAPADAAAAHPTTLATSAIVTELANPTVAADRRTALEAELRTRRIIVAVSCRTTSDWWTDEIQIRVTSAAGVSALSLQRESVDANQTHQFSVPLATLLPVTGTFTIDVREADVTTTDTILSIPFAAPYGVTHGENASYAADVTFEEQMG